MSPSKEDPRKDPRGSTGNLDEDSAKSKSVGFPSEFSQEAAAPARFPEEELDSDDDEALTDHGPSDADSDPEVGRKKPPLSSLLHLTDHHCRVLYNAKLQDGSKSAVYCGRESTKCPEHMKQRVDPADGRRAPVGFHDAVCASRQGLRHAKIDGYFIS